MTIDRRSLSAQIGAVVDARSLAIYRPLPDGEPAFEATGFVIDFGDVAVLVSAGHALSAPRVGLNPFGARAFWLRNTPKSDFDPARLELASDIGSVLLDSDERAQLPIESLTSPSALSTEGPTPQRRLYRAVGYRARNQVADYGKARFLNGETVLTVQEARDSSYLHSRISRDTVLLLGARRRNLRGPNGGGGVPSWRGMSGCPIWMVPVSAHPRLVAHPFAAGMLIGSPEHSRDLVFTIRMSGVIEHLERSHPRLAGRVRAAAS